MSKKDLKSEPASLIEELADPVAYGNAWNQIHQLGSPMLKTPAKPVQAISQSIMEQTMTMVNVLMASGVPALAATQVGFSSRIVVAADLEALYPVVMINPEIDFYQQELAAQMETSCSLARGQVAFPTSRPKGCTLSFFDINGQEFEGELHGFEATSVMQAIDYLDGRTPLEYVKAPHRLAATHKIMALIADQYGTPAADWYNIR